MERTLVLLKPDCVQRRLMGQIITRFENKGFNIVALKMIIAGQLATEQEVERFHAEAEAAFRKALELDPFLGDAHNNLGALYDRMGRQDEAEREFRLAADDPAYPTPEKALLNLGLLYASQGRDEEAIRVLRKAVEIDRKYYRAHYELASLLDKGGSIEEAVREYVVAAPDYQASGEYHYRVGFAYFRLGERAKARESLLRAIEVSPGSEAAARSDEVLKLLR